MKKLFSSVGLVGWAIGAAIANPPSPEPMVPLPQLVQQLGADDFRTREKASASLENAGPAAIPHLQKALQTDNPEIRLRAAAILAKLQRTVDSTERLAARRVALNYRNMPLGAALNDFRSRSGLPIQLDASQLADPFRQITLQTEELPVWEALEAFCTAAGLRERFHHEIDFPKKPTADSRRYISLPLLPTAERVPIVLGDDDGAAPRAIGDRRTAVRVLVLPPSFPGHRTILGRGEVVLCFDIMPTPGLKWQDGATVKIRQVIDDAARYGSGGSRRDHPAPADGQEVVAFAAPGGAVFGPGGIRFDPTGRPIYPATIPNPRIVPVSLKLGTPHAKKLRRLEGTVVGEIDVAHQPLITVKDPIRYVGNSFYGPGEVQLKIRGVNEHGDQANLQLELAHPTPWMLNARRGWNPGGIWPESPQSTQTMPTVRLYDASGREITTKISNYFVSTSNDDQLYEHTFSLSYAKTTHPPAKLVVVGTRPVVVEVPFVLENVPLP
ncbi:MAG: HEAT repeat domain-containing protein [Gemmataceae bacterium]|nr:HEAT repeat domain-containing protein [Gemmata sp.]MDW8199000.1 HEAT repeat domain-containing protein [Gemmataceae bacterium]